MYSQEFRIIMESVLSSNQTKVSIYKNIHATIKLIQENDAVANQIKKFILKIPISKIPPVIIVTILTKRNTKADEISQLLFDIINIIASVIQNKSANLPTNQAPSIIGPIFPKIIFKESIDIIKDNDQYNYNEGFLKNHLDRPQTSLFSLLKEIKLSDIIEIWELYGLTKFYKHYIILLIDDDHLCICLTIINRELDIQNQYIQANLQDETVGIQLKIPDIFTNNTKQCLQSKVKYAYEFGKIKKAFNLALDLGCENEIINMINKFIDCKKNIIKDANNENNKENLQILNPIV
ncbi:hypothetical protein C1646_770752 [Rhizophagus diaphanus]|nr:hypothetical protein C1646_770752 [Rhizophagus diaphanus] [Rhizophagus sp. MUCL 43196]